MLDYKLHIHVAQLTGGQLPSTNQVLIVATGMRTS